jgi:lipid-binding SYLF domain-containing protein
VRKPLNKLCSICVASLFVPVIATAAPITNFAAFGGNQTTLGNNVVVNSGLVGSNNNMTLGEPTAP